MADDLVANFELDAGESFDALFEIYASGTVWGNIDGNINDQTDLKDALDTLSGDISDINTTINGYGNIVTHDVNEFATAAEGALAGTALQPGSNISELNNDVGYITSSSIPTVNNATITIQKNGSTVESFTLNQSNNETVNITVPTQASDINAVPTSRTINGKALSSNITLNASDVGALSSTTTINDLTTEAQQNALNSGATTTNIGQIATNASNISAINDLIPNQATSSNQLADKNFVNSSIATNTANFIGTFQSVADLEAYSGTLTNNDYAFVETTDSAGNTLYDRYKWNGTEWLFEYELNNSSFTAQQWATINSGVTSNDVTLIGTALQPNDNITELTNNAGYITGIDSTDVTTALGYTPYDSSNPNGYISSASISTLTDVNLTNLSNGEGLIYNSTSQKWENGTLATSATWGNITGTLSNQTDLQDALDVKQNELIAGTNISITDNAGGVITVTGTESVTLDSAVNNSLSNVTLSGLCVQADTPTPSTPANIACNNGVIKCNRVIDRYSGSISASGVIVSNSNYAINVAPVKPNKTYTVYGMSVYALYTELPVMGSTSYNGSRVISGTNSITIPNDSTIKYIAIRTTTETLGAFYSNDELIYTDGTVETVTDDIGNTATAETLLSVGNYTDEQSIIDGAISHDVGIAVFDGTESWSYDSTYERFTVTITDLITGLSNRKMPLFCSHYPAISDGRNIANVPYNSIYGTNTNSIFIKTADYTTVEGYTDFLKGQYQNGTPLIVVYPLDETTTTTVIGQNINVNTGNNIIAITQSGINNLLISATYTKYDTSTISFVNNTKLIQDTSTGTQTLTIQGTPTTQQQSINIGTQSLASSSLAVSLGFDAQTNKSGGVCMGYSTRASGAQAIGIGYRARATANYAIQLGYGTNSTASTMYVGFNNTNYQLLDGTTGKIPNARLTLDATPTQDSTNGITSGGVFTALGNYALTSSLATVATTGAYSDLSGTPTIPTVNNATLTITQGGTTKGTFTANASSDVTIDLDAGGSGGGTWGSITGTLSDQTDLQNALNAKQNKLIAGDDIYFTTTVGLPADYTEIVSVTNAATTYVNTGVRLTADNAVMEIHFSITADSASGSFYLWQQRSSTSGNILGLSGASTGSTITMNVGGTAITSDIARVAGHTYFVRATYNSGNGTLYVKDETAGTEATNTGTYTWGLVNKDLHMFGNGLNSSQTAGAGITVDYARLTVNGNKTFEACFAKNSSNVVGIYNTIGRTFGTAGIGSLTAGADSDKSKDVIYTSGFLKNTATNIGSGTITIGGTPSANTSALNIGGSSSTGSAYTVAIGQSAQATGQYGTSVGRSTKASAQNSTALGSGASASGAYSTIVGSNSAATGNSAIAIGISAKANANYAIQIGNGTNATASTMQVSFNGSDFQLLDGTTGKIPYARLPYDNSTITVNSNNQLQAITRNIGEIVASTIPLTDAGLHLLDGALISGSGSYADFVDYIADLYDSGNYNDIFDTEANWQSAVTTYGVCGKFVYDSVNSTVRLPKITGITEGTIDPTVLGDLVQAGLPNITGEFTENTASYNAQAYGQGAFGKKPLGVTGSVISYTSGTDYYQGYIDFDASRLSSIYGNSSTVQPQSIKVLYYIVIATSTKTAIQVDIDEIATDLNGKADTDGSNMISSVKNFDGAWISSYSEISTATAINTYSIDMSSYLPNDNYSYEVYYFLYINTDNNNATFVSLNGDSIFGGDSYATSNSEVKSTQGTFIVDSTRILTMRIFDNSADALHLRALRYRRLGTNS